MAAAEKRTEQVNVPIPYLYACGGDPSAGKQPILQFKGFQSQTRHEVWLLDLPIRERWRRLRQQRKDQHLSRHPHGIT